MNPENNTTSCYFSREDGARRSAKSVMTDLYAKFPWLGQPYRHLAKHVPKDAVILDAGCGRGTYLQIALRILPKASFHACDREDARESGVVRAVPFSCCDFELHPLPYADLVFHHINCTHVIEHLHDPLRFLRECHRVLAPGGTLLVEAPDVRLTLLPHLPLLAADRDVLNFWDDPTHVRPWSRPGLRKLAEMAGFEDVLCTFFVHRWAHLLALPLAFSLSSNFYKGALLHALGFFCGMICRK